MVFGDRAHGTPPMEIPVPFSVFLSPCPCRSHPRAWGCGSQPPRIPSSLSSIPSAVPRCAYPTSPRFSFFSPVATMGIDPPIAILCRITHLYKKGKSTRLFDPIRCALRERSAFVSFPLRLRTECDEHRVDVGGGGDGDANARWMARLEGA